MTASETAMTTRVRVVLIGRVHATPRIAAALAVACLQLYFGSDCVPLRCQNMTNIFSAAADAAQELRVATADHGPLVVATADVEIR